MIPLVLMISKDYQALDRVKGNKPEQDDGQKTSIVQNIRAKVTEEINKAPSVTKFVAKDPNNKNA